LSLQRSPDYLAGGEGASCLLPKNPPSLSTLRASICDPWASGSRTLDPLALAHCTCTINVWSELETTNVLHLRQNFVWSSKAYNMRIRRSIADVWKLHTVFDTADCIRRTRQRIDSDDNLDATAKHAATPSAVVGPGRRAPILAERLETLPAARPQSRAAAEANSECAVCWRDGVRGLREGVRWVWDRMKEGVRPSPTPARCRPIPSDSRANRPSMEAGRPAHH